MPAGDRDGSAVVICPNRMNGRAGMRPTLRSAPKSTKPSTSTPRCTVPAEPVASFSHGTATVEGPVQLEGRVVPVEPREVVTQARGQEHLAEQPGVQGRRRHVGEDRAAGCDDRAVGQPHAVGATAADQHLGDRGVRPDLHAERFRPGSQRPGEDAGAALRHREADVLAEHGQQPAEHAAAGTVGRDVGVHGVAGEQQAPAVAAEGLLAQPAHGRHREPRQAQGAGGLQGSEQARPGRDRRERGEQCVEDAVAHPLPLARTAPARRPRRRRRTPPGRRPCCSASRCRTAARPSSSWWARTVGACTHSRPCRSSSRSRISGLAAASG